MSDAERIRRIRLVAPFLEENRVEAYSASDIVPDSPDSDTGHVATARTALGVRKS